MVRRRGGGHVPPLTRSERTDERPPGKGVHRSPYGVVAGFVRRDPFSNRTRGRHSEKGYARPAAPPMSWAIRTLPIPWPGRDTN